MTKLILVRHGQTDWNKAKRVQGQLDIPLNNDGKRQIQVIISGLAHLKGIKRIDAVYSSCLLRCSETAEEIGKVFGLRVSRLRELNELDQGVWQGLLEKQITARYRKLYSAWKTNPLATRPPNGEEIKDAHKRVISAVKKIISRHKNRNICIVVHEIMSAIIKCHYKHIGLDHIWEHLPKNASWEVLEARDG